MVFNDYEQQLKRMEINIQEAEYPEENKSTLFDFENQLFLEGAKYATIKNHMSKLHYFCKQVDKPISQLQKKDMENYVGYLERNVKSEESKSSRKATLKKFFRWYNGGEDPDISSWMKLNSKRHKNRKLPDQLLTAEEVKAMIDAAYYLRDKALIAVLYDTGARISEIGNLKIKDITFDQYGAILKVDGKTGMRRVRILFSVPYLSNWINNHPLKNEQGSFVWITLARQTKGEQLKYNSISDNLKTIAKRAGIKKRVYNHLFRHSRSTELAQHLTQAQMEEHLGWTHGSNMPQTYIHMSGKQVDDAILKMHGLKKDEDTQPELTARQCPRCDEINGPTSKFCSKCGVALDTQTALQVDDQRSNVMDTFMELIQNNPELIETLNRLKKEGEDKYDD